MYWITNEIIYTIFNDSSAVENDPSARFDAIELELDHTISRRFRIGEDDPLSAAAEVAQKTLFRRCAWNSRVEMRTRMTSTEDHFLLEAELKAYDNEEEFFARNWQRRVKRDLL